MKQKTAAAVSPPKSRCGASSRTVKPAPTATKSPASRHLRLQRMIGNRASANLLGSLLQAKLRVGPANDPLEREADRTAEALLRGGGSSAAVPVRGRTPRPQAQRACAECEKEKLEEARRQEPPEPGEEELLSRKERRAGGSIHPGADFGALVESQRGRGHPLPPGPRTFFEPRFGRDLDDVRVHTGPSAMEAARRIEARAFTLGRDIFFDAGEFSPQTLSGRRLLAHELTHVVQQTPGAARPPAAPLPLPATEAPTETWEETEAAEAEQPDAQEAAAGQPAPLPLPPADEPDGHASSLIVADDATRPAPGRMRRSEFLSRLRKAVSDAAEAAFQGTEHTAKDCPWIELSFRFYERQDADRLERDLLEYVPEAGAARSAQDYIPPVVERVRRSVKEWVESGRITGVPGRLPGKNHIAALAGAFPELPGGILFKSRNGGPRSPHSPAAVRHRLGEGRPFQGGARNRMEAAFGANFSNVRVHHDGEASRLARDHNARAFTVGSHIAFDDGEYRPGTLLGDALIAHELAHVVQQEAPGRPAQPPNGAGASERDLEGDADRTSLGVLAALAPGLKRLVGDRLGVRPRLRSGLRLSRCDCGDSFPTPKFDAADFEIRGKLNRPHDLSNIYFERNDYVLDKVELEKVPKIIDRHGVDTNLTLNAFRSEDEPASLAHDRGVIVWGQLGIERTEEPAHPAHTGEREIVDNGDAGLGRLAYRELRKVEVKKTPAGQRSAPSNEPVCFDAQGEPLPTKVACAAEPNAFTDALPVAREIVEKTIDALQPSNLEGDEEEAVRVRKLLQDLFGGTNSDPAVRETTAMGHAPTILSHMQNLLLQVGRLPETHQCHNRCKDSCGNRPAINNGVGDRSVMTLCELFFKPHRTVLDNATTLVHESAHATPGLVTQDLAYRTERRIRFLPDSEALRNTDSYVLLARLIARPGSITIGPRDPDVLSPDMDESEQLKATQALAFLEKWLDRADFDTGSLFGTVSRSVPPATGWATGQGDAFDQKTMKLLSKVFGLTKPPRQPTETDKRKLAAIHDRYDRMVDVVRGRPVTINKTDEPADELWQTGSGRPESRARPTVTLSQSFFTLPDDRRRIRRLVYLLAQATPGISYDARRAYVEGADRIRKHRGVPPD